MYAISFSGFSACRIALISLISLSLISPSLGVQPTKGLSVSSACTEILYGGLFAVSIGYRSSLFDSPKISKYQIEPLVVVAFFATVGDKS
jgi:hypothetical protein